MPSAHVSRLEEVRVALRKLPRVAETMQWGSNLVFWTLDKAVGGKMFAIVDMEPESGPPVSFAAGPERALSLLERDGVRPAPYLARAHWVALEDWHVLPLAELLAEMRSAYEYVAGRMPARVQRLYAMPPREYRAAVRDARSQADRTSGRSERQRTASAIQ